MRASACTILWRFLKLYSAFRATHPAESISARGSELLSRTLYYILCDMSLFTWTLIFGHYIPIHNVWIAQRRTSAGTDSAFEKAIVQMFRAPQSKLRSTVYQTIYLQAFCVWYATEACYLDAGICSATYFKTRRLPLKFYPVHQRPLPSWSNK